MAAVMFSAGTVPSPTRLQVLDPFIADLRRTLDDPALERRGDAPVCLRVSGTDVTVDPWTSKRLDPRYRAANPSLANCCCVVTQSVALLAKCATDLASLEEQGTGSTGRLSSARAELMLDAAIGGSLVKDVQRIIDALLKQGHRDEAGHLSKFHHQLRHTVYDLRKRVSPEYRSTVETLAEQLVDRPPEEEPEEAGPAAPPKPTPPIQTAQAWRRPLPGIRSPTAPRRQQPPARSARAAATATLAPSRRLPLRTAALATLLVVTSLILNGSRRPDSPPETRTVKPAVADPSLQSTVRLIEDRARSVYVTVEEDAWNKLDEERRRDFVQELIGPLFREHYSGLFVRSAGGRPLAQWLGKTGVTLLDDRAEDADRRAAMGI